MKNCYHDHQTQQCVSILTYLKAKYKVKKAQNTPYHPLPDEPNKNAPREPDINNDPTRIEPGINEPTKNDPTRIDDLPEIFDNK